MADRSNTIAPKMMMTATSAQSAHLCQPCKGERAASACAGAEILAESELLKLARYQPLPGTA
jgi:hypothetical protein